MPGLNKGQLGLGSGSPGLTEGVSGLWSGASGLVSGGGGTPAPPVATAFWNPADKAAGLTLSNANQTVTMTSGVAPLGVRGTMAAPLFAHYGFSVRIDSPNQIAIGVAAPAFSLTAYPGGVGQSSAYYATGDIYTNASAPISGLATFGVGDIISVVVYDAGGYAGRQAWYLKNGVPVLGDPVARTGGQPCAHECFPLATLATIGNNVTLVDYPLPAGYIQWPAALVGFDAQFNTSPALAYSEEGRLVVRSGDTTRFGLRGLTGHDTGKWYAELLPIGARLRFAGVVDDTFSVRGAGGDAGTNRAGIEGSNLVGYPHVIDPLGQFAAPGVPVRIAYYADIDQFWIALGAGPWNGSAFASPVSGLGGLSAGGLVGEGFVGATLRPIAGAGVRYRLPGDLGYNLPAGYEEWSS